MPNKAGIIGENNEFNEHKFENWLTNWWYIDTNFYTHIRYPSHLHLLQI